MIAEIYPRCAEDVNADYRKEHGGPAEEPGVKRQKQEDMVRSNR
jgi:hypothetical protein